MSWVISANETRPDYESTRRTYSTDQVRDAYDMTAQGFFLKQHNTRDNLEVLAEMHSSEYGKQLETLPPAYQNYQIRSSHPSAGCHEGCVN